MMAASLKLAATLEERQGVMRLLYQMAPESAKVVAEMLGFDPKMVIPLLEVRPMILLGSSGLPLCQNSLDDEPPCPAVSFADT